MTPNIYIYSRSKQSKAKQNKGGFNINWNKIRQNTKKKEKRIGYVWNIKDKHKTATVKEAATKNRALTSLCIEKFLQQS